MLTSLTCRQTDKGWHDRSFLCAQQAYLAERAGQKIILQRQLADLCVQRLQIHRRLSDGRARRAEHIGRSLLQLPLPFRDLVRMNLKLLRQFRQRAPSSLRDRLVSFVGIMPISEPSEST
jgi:hypothetical protein